MPRRFFTTLVMVSMVAACSSDTTGPGTPSPIDGLQQPVARDSTGNPPPAPPLPTGDGQIRGTVVGQSSGGGDTLATAPRLAGATITAYPLTSTNPQDILGPSVATVATGNDGKFTLPALPAGQYVITVEPATAQEATYHGQWIRATIYAQSGDHPWWVVLSKK